MNGLFVQSSRTNGPFTPGSSPWIERCARVSASARTARGSLRTPLPRRGEARASRAGRLRGVNGSVRRSIGPLVLPVSARMSRPVSRILFPGALRPSRSAVIHLGLPSPAGSSGLPAGSGGQPSSTCAGTSRCPLGLAPGGVYRAVPVTRDAGGLLHHLFTLTRPESGRAVWFLWHFPAGHPGLPLATTLPCGVRTFLDAGRTRAATARSTHPRRSILVAASRYPGTQHPGGRRSRHPAFRCADVVARAAAAGSTGAMTAAALTRRRYVDFARVNGARCSSC